MSGTIGISAHGATAAGVRSLHRSVARRARAVRQRGGLTTPVALPLALLITGGTTWVVVTAASRAVAP